MCRTFGLILSIGKKKIFFQRLFYFCMCMQWAGIRTHTHMGVETKGGYQASPSVTLLLGSLIKPGVTSLNLTGLSVRPEILLPLPSSTGITQLTATGFFFCSFVLETGSLLFVVQAGLQRRDTPASASRIPGLKVWIIYMGAGDQTQVLMLTLQEQSLQSQKLF